MFGVMLGYSLSGGSICKAEHQCLMLSLVCEAILSVVGAA